MSTSSGWAICSRKPAKCGALKNCTDSVPTRRSRDLAAEGAAPEVPARLRTISSFPLSSAAATIGSALLTESASGFSQSTGSRRSNASR